MKFGVVGTARIARGAVIPAIREAGHEVLAVASRDEGRARAFADEVGVPRSYGSYDDLLADDDLDAAYVPLPNGLHAEWAKRAADAGLHVLCEKPLAANAEAAREVVEHCADRGVTLMEAFMYRYHPRTERAAEIAREELTGARFVDAAFSFTLADRDGDVRLDPDLAGGSLMDVGCYAVSAARLLLGEPERVYARSRDARDVGVDTQLLGVLEFADGATAAVRSSFDTAPVQRYRVEAENGWLQADGAYNPPDDAFELEYGVDGRRATERFDPENQYRLEVEHFADCVASGAPPRTGGEEAVRNMAVIDALYESAEREEPVPVEVP